MITNKPKVLFGRALKVNSILNLAGALPNSFSKRNDSMLISWSDYLKWKRLRAKKVVSPNHVKWFSIVILKIYAKK